MWLGGVHGVNKPIGIFGPLGHGEVVRVVAGRVAAFGASVGLCWIRQDIFLVSAAQVS